MKISRRALLGSAGLLWGCGPKLAKRFNGYCFVANEGDRTVAAVNLSRFTVEKRFALDSAPRAMLGLPGTRRVLAFSPGNATVTEIDAETLAVSRHRKAGNAAREMRLTSDGATLWLLVDDPAALIPVDIKTFRPGTPIQLPGIGGAFDLDATGRFAAVTFPALKMAAIADLAAGRMARSFETGGEPGPVRFRKDGKQALIGNRAARTIAVADVATGRVLVNLPLALEPERFCFNDNGGQMFVSGKGMDAVAIVYPYQTVVSETILAGRDPGAMVTSDNQLFVANTASGDVTVIDIDDRSVVARIPVGQEPVSISMTPDNEYMLVLNRKSCDMAVVRLSKIADSGNPLLYRYKRAGLFTVVPVGDSPVSAAICHL
jgi:YVTN family beta-propeller protein